MKRISSLLFGAILVFTLNIGLTYADDHGDDNYTEDELANMLPPGFEEGFYDVDTQNPYYSAIRYLKFFEVVKGYDNGSFGPDNKISRAEFVKINIASQFGESEINSCNNGKQFKDVPSDHWVLPFLCVATNHDVIKGYEDGTFKPEANINFAEAAKIINVVFNFETQPDPIWYKPYVINFEENNISPATIDSIDKEITRGEMADMIFRIKARVSNKPTTSFFVTPVTPTPPTEISDLCRENYYTMAFIVVTDPESPLSNDRKKLYTTLGNTFEKAFNLATNNLAVMNVNEISDLPYKTDWETTPGQVDYSLIAQEFYETHEDDYDLLTVFRDDGTAPGGPASHGAYNNSIRNIGIDLSDNSAQFGSKGRLLGITGDMSLNTENVSSIKDYVVWVLLHETGHQWCCGIDDPNLKIADGAHFSLGLETTNNSILDGIGGSTHYVFNKNNGTFLQMASEYAEVFTYHPFNLYFMGLLPEDQYDVAFDVYDVGSYEDQYAGPLKEEATFFKSISVNDIIDTVGPRSCEDN